MKFLCDVHISYKICKSLEKQGHTAIHVNDILDKWFTEDNAICDYADKNNLIVITKDEDFRASFFLKKKPKKLIRIILGNISTQRLIQIINESLVIIEGLNTNECFFIEIGEELTLFYP
ncbi:MAG: DUF5615 family PIN-like protein [Emticicia sp.]|nr:DUF5615 family PIN-like protein [Emticicia sp.]